MEKHIIAPLKKRGIDGEDRDEALFGHPRRHGDGMALRDAHVEKPVRKPGGKVSQSRAPRHGGGEGADP